MIVDRFVLKKYNWAITVLLDCTCLNILDVMDYLDSIGCPDNLKSDAVENMQECHFNTGFTYSNYIYKRTVMVIGKADSAGELVNTITHECYHFILHISKALNIKNEETLATLTGIINMNLIEDARGLSVYDK